MLCRRNVLPVACLAAIVLLGGCASGGKSGAGARADKADQSLSPTDPCADRLHDMCGGLLIYYFQYHRLPPRLDDLRLAEPALGSVPFACPTTGQLYVYNPAGLEIKDQPGRFIVYDASPSHMGMRWAISIIEPRDGSALMTKVIALPEDKFPQK